LLRAGRTPLRHQATTLNKHIQQSKLYTDQIRYDGSPDPAYISMGYEVRTRSKAAEIVVEDKNVDYAPASRNAVSRQPTSDDEAQALRYAYTVLMSTVSLTLLSRVRLFPGR
jgi:hypothetical protein